VSIFRFDSYQHLKGWEESDERRRWLARLRTDMIECEAREQSMTGLEFWFTATAVPCLGPPRYKMVIVLVPVIFLMLNLLSPIFLALLHGLAPLLQSFIVIATQVILMTYLIMPLLTRVLSRWLFAQRA
jgi:antibiotic biosynthesis monooxygenase (ABM) superfamily enzyme